MAGDGQVTLGDTVIKQGARKIRRLYEDKILAAFAGSSADSFALRNHGMKAILSRQFPARAFSVDYASKDLGYALELAENGGIDAAGARNVLRLFEKAIDAGVGDEYFPVVSRILNREV